MTAATTAPDSEEPSLAAQCVRSLLERHGVPRHKHSTAIAEVLGLSYSQAHRKMGATAPWTLEELARVAGRFGELLSELVQAGSGESPEPASLLMGALRLPCQVWLGPSVDPLQLPLLVAIGAPGAWLVLPATQAGVVPARTVRRLVLQPEKTHRKRVAVVDDHPDVADSLAEQLAYAGFETQAFYSADALLAVAESARFDGYVMDWVLGRGTARGLIEEVRAQDLHCPIVVFTGQIEAKRADEREVAAALRSHGLLFHEKPVRAVIIAAELSRAFQTQ